MNDSLNGSTDMRWWKIVGAAAVLTIIVIIGIMIIGSTDEEESVKSDVEFSQKEQNLIQRKTEKFISDAGSFGVYPDVLTDENIHDISKLITREQSGYEDYYQSRSEAYENINKHIHSTSPLLFDIDEVNSWKVPQEYNEMFTYNVDDVSVEVPETGNRMNLEGESTETVEVVVDFDSTQTKRVVTAEDTSWDGSYYVLEKEFQQQRATFTLVKENNTWYIYSKKPMENEFLLVTWEDPNSGDFGDSQFDFERIETLTPSVVPGRDEEGGSD